MNGSGSVSGVYVVTLGINGTVCEPVTVSSRSVLDSILALVELPASWVCIEAMLEIEGDARITAYSPRAIVAFTPSQAIEDALKSAPSAARKQLVLLSELLAQAVPVPRGKDRLLVAAV